jgi:O-antigen/teichoic acid export membrane protein
MSRTKRLVDGILLSYCYQGLVMLVGLWLTPFLLHRLGQHNYGIWLVGLQSLTYLSLLDLGVIGLLPREVAFLSGRIQRGEDPQLVRTLLEENACVILWQSPLLIAALAISFFFFRTLDPAVHGVLVIIFFTYGAQVPFRIYYAALEGLQDFAFLGYLQMGAWLVGVAANVSLVFFGRGLYGLAIGWSLSQSMVTAGCIVRMYARHRMLTPKRIKWLRWGHLFRYLRAGLWVSVTQITQMLIKGSDVLLLAGLEGPSAVVPYSCSIKLTSVLANQPQVILQAAQPGLTQLRATADPSHISQVIGSLSQAMLMLSGGVACAVIAINGGFVRHWVGANQYLGFVFTLLIAFSMLARHWNTSTIYTLFCFGKERYISIIGLIDGGCFVLLMYLLVRRWGVIGIPIASTASACLISLPCNIRVLSQVTSVSWWEQITPVRKWFVPFAFAASIAWAANFMIKPSTYPACAFTALGVLAIYSALEFRVIHESIWGSRLKEMLQAGWRRVFQLIWPGSTPSVVAETALTTKGKLGL